MSSTLLEAENLSVSYGPVQAVNSISFTAQEGQVLGFLGGNGAGKSSTLKAISGVNPPTSGRLTIAGHDMAVPAEAELARRVVGYTPDVGGLIRQSTPREHLHLVLASRGRLTEMPYALALVEEFGLTSVLDRETSGFSHGMSRRLSVVLAALSATQLLALDEPFDGVDPVGVEATMSMIRRARDQGLAVLISTHLLPLLVEVSDDIYVMRQGSIVEKAKAALFTGQPGKDRYEAILSAGPVQ